MNKKLYEIIGIPLISLPSTKKNRFNNKRRNVGEIGVSSAAHIIGMTGIRPEEPFIFCGKYNKALPIVRQLVKMSARPFVILGTRRDLAEDSCLRLLDIEWENEIPEHSLPGGNGMLILKSGGETNLQLKDCLNGWDSHLIIICLGNGLQIDQEILNILNSIGHYILLTEALHRSVKGIEGDRLTPEELLSSMEYILVSSIGTAGKDLMKILPDYECEKITNTTDVSWHRDEPHEYKGGQHHRNGGGIRFSQSKFLESRCIFSQDELTKIQDSNSVLIYNARCAHTWVSKITG
ncbi:MAG: hypothetical protein Q4Q26_09125 [Eubacteriales bacterium]|nr:hypothetical protein [Eubacteriales bacterium]